MGLHSDTDSMSQLQARVAIRKAGNQYEIGALRSADLGTVVRALPEGAVKLSGSHNFRSDGNPIHFAVVDRAHAAEAQRRFGLKLFDADRP